MILSVVAIATSVTALTIAMSQPRPSPPEPKPNTPPAVATKPVTDTAKGKSNLSPAQAELVDLGVIRLAAKHLPKIKSFGRGYPDYEKVVASRRIPGTTDCVFLLERAKSKEFPDLSLPPYSAVIGEAGIKQVSGDPYLFYRRTCSIREFAELAPQLYWPDAGTFAYVSHRMLDNDGFEAEVVRRSDGRRARYTYGGDRIKHATLLQD